MVKTVIWMSNLPQIASACICECAVSEGVDIFPFCQDMFPRTGTIPDINQKVSCHVETVVLLSQLKQKPDDYINVTIELDDMDITSAETKATYGEGNCGGIEAF